MSLYSRLDRIAADVEKLNRQVNSVANSPQSQRTSVEGGSIDFNDSDGNLKAIVGEQDDGGTTVNVISGPTPPTPANFSVTVDHGSLTVHWDGDFENDAVAPSDWARWSAYAQEGQFVVPDRTTSIGGTDSASGGEVTAGVLKGTWTVTLLAWSQAGKPSAMAEPVTVDVPGYGEIVLEEIDAAETEIKNGNDILVNAQDTLGGKLDSAFGEIDSINDDMSDLGDAVQGAIASANGKNTVHFDDHAPTPSDEGVAGDTWFVGRVGRPDEVVEATNLAMNPSLTSLNNILGPGQISPSSGTATIVTSDWSESGDTALKISPTSSNNTTAADVIERYNFTDGPQYGGRTFTISANFHMDSAQTGSLWSNARRIVVRAQETGSSVNQSFALSPQAPNVAGDTRLSVTFTLPDELDYWYVLFSNGSSSVPVYWDSVTVEEGDGAGDYFDGDTVDGETDDESHYRWTGTPHASTSEKFLPSAFGGSDKWNVTAQYRHDGDEWVQVELSHEVISSLDVGSLTAGTAAIKEAVVQKLFAEVVVAGTAVADEFIGENAILTGAVTAPKITASEELWAKLGQFVKIRSEQLESDAIDSMVITSPTIQSARSGRRWVANQDSIRVIDGNDDVRTELSPDGSTFKGEVEAETLVVNDGAEFKANNTLAQGASLMLAAGVTDPTSPPTVQPYWDGIKFNKPEGTDPYGLAYAGGKYWTFADVPPNPWGTGGGEDEPVDSLISIDPTNGAVVDTFPMPDTFWAAGGVTAIGDELFMLGPISGISYKYFVRVVSTTGDVLREWEYEDVGWSSTNPLAYKPGIGNDGTNVVIAHCTDAGDLIFRTYNKTTGAKIDGVSTEENVASDITGVYVGDGDFGDTHVVCARASNNSFIRYTPAGNRVDSGGWFTPDRGYNTGIAYVDGKFRSLDPEGTIIEYGDTNTGDESQYWWACYAWAEDFDGNGVTETWSRPSPPKRFMWPRRAKLKLLGQPLPDGVQMILPALAKKETVPSSTDFHSPTWNYVDGESVAYYDTLPTDWETSPSPRDNNNFPEAEPSTLETANKQFQVNGDGSGRWGPLTFNADGSWSGSIVSGQSVITSSSANSTTSVEVTFPPGRFANIPEVTLTVYSNSPRDVSVGVRDVSASSFTINMFSTAVGPRRIAWIAFDQGV